MKSSPISIHPSLVDSGPPIGGRVSNFTFKPSPNMAYSVLFTACLFRMLFGNSIGGLALFQCGVKRGTAVAKVRVKLTDSSRKQGLTDKMLMTWTMTHRLGIRHKHVSVLKHTWMQTQTKEHQICVALLFLTTLVLLTALTGKKEAAKSIHATVQNSRQYLSINWPVHPQMEVLPLFTHPHVSVWIYLMK